MSQHWRDLAETASGGWQRVVGSNYEIAALDSATKILLRETGRHRQAGAQAFHISDRNGRHFKLLVFPRFSLTRLLIMRSYRRARDHVCLPQLHWHDRRTVLLDFVEGEVPRIDDPQFAGQLGTQLARLHATHRWRYSRRPYLYYFDRQLRKLSVGTDISQAALKSLRQYVSAHLPHRLPVTLDYVDIKPDNFVFDAHGQLRLVDMGSLLAYWPMGQDVVGSTYFTQLDQDRFWDSYRHHAIDDYMYVHRRVLRLVQLTVKCARTVQTLKHSDSHTAQHKFSQKLARRERRLQIEMEDALTAPPCTGQ